MAHILEKSADVNSEKENEKGNMNWITLVNVLMICKYMKMG